MQNHYIQFFTATNLWWKKLLKPDKYKQIIVDSLAFLVENNRVKVYGFVIMPNHIHVVWKVDENHKREDVQRDFLKFTAQQIKQDLEVNHPAVLPHFEVNLKDIKLWTQGKKNLARNQHIVMCENNQRRRFLPSYNKT